MSEYNIEQIFRLISNQDFYEWYSEGGSFDNWLRGEEGALSTEEIKKELAEMLH